MPLLTIGVPVYNAELFLKTCIQSILAQSFKDFELIIMDDGSSDSSLDIAKSYIDNRIVVFSDGQNRGISQRLNEQISIAKGKYFVRMDADDIMFPNRLVKQLELLENNSKIDFVACHAVVIDDKDEILGLRKSRVPNSIKDCFYSNPFIHPTVTGRTEWFRKYKYSDELKGVEDRDLWIRSFAESKYLILKEPLLFYRDPLKIKFKTYKFRIMQSIKLYKYHKKSLFDYSFIIYILIVKDYFKLLVYLFLIIFKIDNLLLSKRNKHFEKKLKNDYQLLLDKVKKNVI